MKEKIKMDVPIDWFMLFYQPSGLAPCARNVKDNFLILFTNAFPSSLLLGLSIYLASQPK